MDTLNGKLAGVEEEKLVGRVVELWGFFWDQVLPYVEGVRVLSFYSPSAIVDNMSRCYSPSRPIQFYLPCTVRQRHIEILPQQDKMGKDHPFLHTHSRQLPTLMFELLPCVPSGTKLSSQLPRC
jgi:HbrB-like